MDLEKKNLKIYNWNEIFNKKFAELKRSMVEFPVLKAADWAKSFGGYTDASQREIGGTLTQLDDGG